MHKSAALGLWIKQGDVPIKSHTGHQYRMSGMI